MARRIGIVVAGDVYANPSLVRPFLEDDGYRVDAEVFDGAELLPAVSGAMPDALVVDEDLLAGRPHALEDIRLVSPETKVVVIGSGAGGNGSHVPDAYLERGASLATMSITIGRMVGNGHLGPADVGAGAKDRSVGGLIRFVASVGLPLVAVWTLIVAVTPRGLAPPAADTTDLAETVIFTPQGTDILDAAYEDLDRLIGAVRSGNPVMATIHARALMEARDAAAATGFAVVELDMAITRQLETVAELLSPATIAELQDVLGGLFPELPGELQPGGGSDLILGPATGSSAGGQTGGIGSPGTTPGVISGPIIDGPVIGPIIGGDDGASDLGSGDGRAWGQSHKAGHEADRVAKEAAKDANDGPRHGPPPWANAGHGQANGHANRSDSNGSGAGSQGASAGDGGSDHGNGNGQGRGRGHGKKG